jgi:hypothetical protein
LKKDIDEDLKEIEAVKYLIKYCLTKPNIEGHELLRCLKEMEKIQDIFDRRPENEKELDDLLHLNDCINVVMKFTEKVMAELEEKNNKI